MTRLLDIFLAGGFMMFPLLFLSVVTLAYAIQRGWFWLRLVIEERQVVQDVLTVAQYDLNKAEKIARGNKDLAIARFLSAPLKLNNPTQESFHLAVKAAADQELVDIGGSDKLLESIIIIAPLLGILGTGGGLIATFMTFRNGGADGSNTSGVADSILQALISSAAGIGVAILAFACLRFFVILRARRVDYFSTLGNQLELIYVHFWEQPVEDAKIIE
ncbi:MotA/TolQ/ExbB proton channel family protein [Plectonema cf. radiosum LEGE 06105]|uniref:MotA/TolQ/ExbB proton channel family protein n=1 Tax=Plectonema cf. radiosum LEGE 06105 TaxID=945769 RepID=A0A8J7EZ40_9CYAN|nr:MotA/TolQ/ExbB proton channel family protein [Plectonema radiosum]MBE9212811.1 MotA/TolQ/ExbB proton channel family protein [Plectonema cf. radiosum LEGE 06105]